MLQQYLYTFLQRHHLQLYEFLVGGPHMNVLWGTVDSLVQWMGGSSFELSAVEGQLSSTRPVLWQINRTTCSVCIWKLLDCYFTDISNIWECTVHTLLSLVLIFLVVATNFQTGPGCSIVTAFTFGFPVGGSRVVIYNQLNYTVGRVCDGRDKFLVSGLTTAAGGMSLHRNDWTSPPSPPPKGLPAW